MRRLLGMLRPHRRAVAIEVLIVVGVLLLLAGAALGLNYWLTDASRTATSITDISRIRDVVGIVQAFVWAFLIVAGGIFAYRNRSCGCSGILSRTLPLLRRLRTGLSVRSMFTSR